MRHYAVSWRIPGGGAYAPPDPCTTFDGGHSDAYGTDVVYASSAKQAVALVKQARPAVRAARARLLRAEG